MPETSPLRTVVTVAGLALVWLAALAGAIFAADLDGAILAALYARDTPALASAAALLTDMGGVVGLTLVTAAAALLFVLKGRPRSALILIAIAALGRGLVAVQKLGFDRARPAAEDHLVIVHSMSFPSGHAANATITYLAIALLAAPLLPTRGLRVAAIALALLLSLLIGLSRIVLGVHWPSDVVGGWAFGLAWTLGLLHLSASRELNRAQPPMSQRQ